MKRRKFIDEQILAIVKGRRGRARGFSQVHEFSLQNLDQMRNIGRP